MPLHRLDHDKEIETNALSGSQSQEPAPAQAEVVMAALRGEKTPAELAHLLDVHPNQITTGRVSWLKGPPLFSVLVLRNLRRRRWI